MRSMDSDYSDLISDGNVSFKHEEVVVQVSSAAYGSEMWTRRVELAERWASASGTASFADELRLVRTDQIDLLFKGPF